MDSKVEQLLSLEAVRARAHTVFRFAQQGKLNHFDYHPEKLDEVADYVMNIIERDFGPDRYHLIPPHGRWQHFEVGDVPRIANLRSDWEKAGHDAKEQARSLVDLFFVSVLLDAGAGDTWRYTEPGTGAVYTRSEGIAVASLYMYLGGMFANADSSRKDMVHGEALRKMSLDTLSTGFQASEGNPLLGVSARGAILHRLGESLLNLPEIFGPSGRPGLLVEKSKGPLDYSLLWTTLQKTLIPIWPSDRTRIRGQPIGDAWPLKVLSQNSEDGSDPETASIQPFHKLTQWLAYTLMVPFTRLLSMSWTKSELGTGLPEYRNGGLFVDMELLTLKPDAQKKGLKVSKSELPCFGAGDDEIVEWRAMTVALLDELHKRVESSSDRFGGVRLSLPQMLEAGSWKAGRELAAEKRPATKSSPILNSGDGTLF
ncbi:conserved hypothetical protein [Aspergillus terreus NIH2624]|uniref:DUF1688-domain-containing protein n=1 Tax=Aspergillus terreus (strain NIH 2624 / FGSC A1156) TaxID=341663 RepID=Q0CG96_ASPTN|nr:uncharacterized protein ATEG_07296 [Aspergillus terreus NIH2624]EAU32680.1 conserved hypothetical protein [Aspergillus terreus NIH2624]